MKLIKNKLINRKVLIDREVFTADLPRFGIYLGKKTGIVDKWSRFFKFNVGLEPLFLVNGLGKAVLLQYFRF